jgi:predicted O-methyltransferase YrrM
MLPITDPRIEKYLMRLALDEDAQLREMERIAKQKNFPIVDRLVGRLLFLLTRMKNPKLVVELGSGFGYSAYWFARAMSRGKVVLTDHSAENIGYAQAVFKDAGMTQRAVFHTGDAVKIARQYRNIDILFVDIDKHQYAEAVQAVRPHLAKDALIIADNTLWYGKVAGRHRDRDTEGIRRFNDMMFSSADFFSCIVPLRDGVLLSQRLS